MIVNSGTAAAIAASSGSWGWNSQASKLNPIRASVLAPERNSGVAIMCSNGPWWLSWISSLGSKPVAWRIPRNRPPPAASWAARTSSTASPRSRSAWLTIPAIVGPPKESV